jgi:DNA-directed RNA polymerase subunit L
MRMLFTYPVIVLLKSEDTTESNCLSYKLRSLNDVKFTQYSKGHILHAVMKNILLVVMILYEKKLPAASFFVLL